MKNSTQKMLSFFLCIVLIAAMALFATGCNDTTDPAGSTPATTQPTEAPATEATEPSTEATEPSTEATEPSTEATEPSTEAAEPSTEAAEPSTEATEPSTEATEPSTEATEPSTEATEPSDEATIVGEGATSFRFTVTDVDGTETKFLVNTDKTTVGEALLELGLIVGEMGDYGLYVTTVNGITADWDTESAYWAFYVNGEYGMTGVDSTEIVADTTYAFVKTLSYTPMGEGATSFYFTVTDVDGTISLFQISTDKTTVGEALLELGLIAGEMGDYGLYVTTVNGITADWDTESAYWAFYVNGEYGMTGVDSTEIVADTTYAFVKTVSAD